MLNFGNVCRNLGVTYPSGISRLPDEIEIQFVRAQSQLNSKAENLTFLDLKQVSFGGPANHGEVTNYSCRTLPLSHAPPSVSL
jgi:hypothetical protein